MGIPPIASYPVPTPEELPANTVAWTADPARAALLIHDMQRYFVAPFTAGQPPVSGMVANILALRELADEWGMPVVYTAQPGSMSRLERGLLHDFWGPGMTADPEARDIIAELAPREGDVVLTKWRYSAFHGTTLGNVLHQRRRDQLIVCGVYAHVGCLMTALDAFTMDIQPFVVADAVADFSAERHRMALQYTAERCGVVSTSAQIARELGDSALLGVSA